MKPHHWAGVKQVNSPYKRLKFLIGLDLIAYPVKISSNLYLIVAQKSGLLCLAVHERQWHAMQWHAMQWHAMQWHARQCMPEQ